MKTTKTLGLFAAATTLGLLSTMCSSETPAPTATGGVAPTGGTVTSTGGTAPTTGGTAPATGGTIATGGTVATGGTTGGTATGGTATGGTAGSATGGSSAGGGAGGGGTSGAGGASGAAGSAGKGGGGAGGGGGGMSGGGGSSGGGGKAGGGGGSGGSGGGATGTFKQVADILGSKCAGCHKSGQTNIVNFTNDAGLYGRITTALTGTAKCRDQIPVDKTTPANSLIPKAIQGAVNIAGADAAHTCNIERMPKGGMMLSAANIATITSWVNAGAPEN